MKENTLRTLIEAAMGGDGKALYQLCEAKGRDILYNCISRMGSLQDGEDAAQEVFIRVQKNIGNLRDPDAFGVWLHRIIANTCNSLQRGRMNPKNMNDIEAYTDTLPEIKPDHLPAPSAEKQEERQLVLQSLHSLPANYQEVLFLYYYEEFTAPQIAEILASNKNTVEHTLRRARAALRRQVERSAGPELRAFSMAGLGSLLHAEATSLVSEGMVLAAIQHSGIAAAAGIGGAVAGAAGSAAMASSAGGAATTAAVSAGAAAGGAVAGFSAAAALGSGLLATAMVGAAIFSGTAPPPSTHVESPPPPSISLEESVAPDPQLESDSLIVAEDSGGSSVVIASRPVSSSGPPPELEAPAPAATPVFVDAQLRGQVGFLRTDGAELVIAQQYYSGCTIYLYQNGVLLAQTSPDEDGGYAFTVHVEPGEFEIRAGTTAAGLQPTGSLQLAVEGGAVSLPSLYFRDANAPTALLHLYDESGGRASRDIASASLEIADETETSAHWQLLCQEDRALVAEGEWESVNHAFAGLEAANNGRGYVLAVTITDLGGNQTLLERQFTQFT